MLDVDSTAKMPSTAARSRCSRNENKKMRSVLVGMDEDKPSGKRLKWRRTRNAARYHCPMRTGMRANANAFASAPSATEKTKAETSRGAHPPRSTALIVLHPRTLSRSRRKPYAAHPRARIREGANTHSPHRIPRRPAPAFTQKENQARNANAPSAASILVLSRRGPAHAHAQRGRSRSRARRRNTGRCTCGTELSVRTSAREGNCKGMGNGGGGGGRTARGRKPVRVLALALPPGAHGARMVADANANACSTTRGHYM